MKAWVRNLNTAFTLSAVKSPCMHPILQRSFFPALLHTEAGAASGQVDWNRCQAGTWAVHCLPEILGHQEALLGGTTACNRSHTDWLTCYSVTIMIVLLCSISTYHKHLKSHVSFVNRIQSSLSYAQSSSSAICLQRGWEPTAQELMKLSMFLWLTLHIQL